MCMITTKQSLLLLLCALFNFTSATFPDPNTPYIVSNTYNGYQKFLDSNIGATPYSDTPFLWINDYGSPVNHKWYFRPSASGYIIWTDFLNMCLDYSTNPNSAVRNAPYLNTCNNGASQLWHIVVGSNNLITIQTTSGACFDGAWPIGLNSDYIIAEISACSGSASQQWLLSTISPCSSCTGFCGAAGGCACDTSNSLGNWGVNCDQESVTSNLFFVYTIGDFMYFLNGNTGTVSWTTSYVSPFLLYTSYNNNPWEQFTVAPVVGFSGGASAIYFNQQSTYIGGDTSHSNLYFAGFPPTTSEYWVLFWVSENTAILLNYEAGLCLDNSPGHSNSPNVIAPFLSPCTGGSNQLWTFSTSTPCGCYNGRCFTDGYCFCDIPYIGPACTFDV